MVRRFVFNFMAAMTMRVPTRFVPDWVERIVVDGCEKHTPAGHRWRDEPMF